MGCALVWLQVNYMGVAKMNETQLAARFGCTVEQVRAMHAKNAQGLREMLFKAERTGCKVNNYTAEQLRAMVADTETLARGEYPTK